MVRQEVLNRQENSKLGISDLIHARERSAALGLATDTSLILSPKVECYKLITGVYVTSGTVGIIGKKWIYSASRCSRWGWQGKIRIMAYVRKEMQIDAGNRIA